MKINIIDRAELQKLLDDPDNFLNKLSAEIFIVRPFVSLELIKKIRRFCEDFSNTKEASWHSCIDDCPDYHRIHNNYEKAHVKSIQHAYYFHPWNENSELIDAFSEIYELKAKLGEMDSKKLQILSSNIPSDGVICRLLVHQYPKGGGGQEEHVDPVADFARVQTIIQASSPNEDYQSGGFYINHERFGIINIDSLTQKGDLILASPSAQHGVAKIDPQTELDWNSNAGRWIIMPIIIHSDYNTTTGIKPKAITNGK